MTVDRLKSGRWRARVRWKGQYLGSATFDLKRDAQAWERERIAAIASGRASLEANASTVGEYLTRWLAGEAFAATTLRQWRYVVKRFVRPRWGTTPLCDVRHSDIAVWVQELSGTPRLAAQSLSCLRAALRLAVEDGVLIRDPSELVVAPKRRSPAREVLALTGEELRRLADAMPTPRDRLMTLVMGIGGLRFGEAAALTVGSLCPEGIRVQGSVDYFDGARPVYSPGKTAAARRTVLLPGWLRAELERLAAGRAESALLFEAAGGLPIRRTTWNSYTLARACGRAGVPRISTHVLRKTAVTQLIAAGVPPARVAAQVGHASPATTLGVYTRQTRADDDVLREALGQIGTRAHDAAA